MCAQDLQDNERVRAQLNAGLNAMNSAMDRAAPGGAAYPQPAASSYAHAPAG